MNRLLMVVACTFALGPSAAAAQVLPDEVSSLPWVIDGGAVEAEARAGSRLFVGGAFRSVARPSDVIGPFGAFDEGTGGLIAADPSLKGAQVEAVVADGSGGWFLGGRFLLGGQVRSIVRLDAAGRRLPWDAEPAGLVYALARSGSTLFVGGAFASAAGQGRQNVAAIDIATQTLLPWNPGVTGPGVYTLHAAGGELYIGGSFTAVAGVSRTNLARVDGQSGVLAPWAPAIAGADAIVRAIATSGASVYVGGKFATAAGLPRRSFAALDRTSGAVLPLAPDPGGGPYEMVMAIVPEGGTVFFGGAFESVAGAPRANAAAIDTGTGALLSWAPVSKTEGTVRTIAVTAGGLVLGGDIGTPTRRRHVVKVDGAGGAVIPEWDPAPGWEVMSVAVDGRNVGVAGYFSTYRATPARGLAGFDLASGERIDLPAVFGRVRALAAAPTTLYVGGFIYAVGGQPRSHVAAIDLTSGTVTPFTAGIQGGSTGEPVLSLLVNGTTLYVGGDFTAIQFHSRQGLAALDTTTAAALPFQAPTLGGMTGGIRQLALAGGRLWVGGPFSAAGGQPRPSLVVLDPVSGALDPLNPATDAPAAFAVDGTSVYLAGSFTSVAGQPRAGLARIDAVTGALDPWSPPSLQGRGAIGTSDGVVVASATATVPLGQIPSLVALDPATGAIRPWGTSLVEGSTRLVLYPDGLLLPDSLAFGSPRYLARRSGGALEPVVDLGVHLQGSLLTMRWTPSLTGAAPTSYRLVAGSQPGLADLANLVIGPAPQLTVPVPPGRYFVRVIPRAGGSEGPSSQEIGFVAGAVGCATVPEAPVLSVSGTPPLLLWTAGAGASPTGYELRAGVEPGAHGLLQVALPRAPRGFSTDGAPPGTYYVVVAATSACGVSAVSNEVQVTVPPPPPPTGLTAQVIGSTVALSWTSPGAVTGYVLEAGSAPGAANLIPGLALGTTPSLAAPGVPPGRYFVRLRARYGVTTSAASPEIVVDVP